MGTIVDTFKVYHISGSRTPFLVNYPRFNMSAAPKLRGLLMDWAKKEAVKGVVFTAAVVAAWNWGVRVPRINAIDNWQKNLDIDKQYIFIRDQGMLHSAAPYGWRWKDTHQWPCAPEDDDEATINSALFQKMVIQSKQ